LYAQNKLRANGSRLSELYIERRAGVWLSGHLNRLKGVLIMALEGPFEFKATVLSEDLQSSYSGACRISVDAQARCISDIGLFLPDEVFEFRQETSKNKPLILKIGKYPEQRIIMDWQHGRQGLFHISKN
jgi:hypothetical protein